jgi:hypothetical protein
VEITFFGRLREGSMSPTLVNQLLIAFLCTVMGFVAGILVALLWQERGRNKQAPGELPAGLVKGQHEPIVRLWRDKKSGKLLTELEGDVYTENKAINKAVRKELKATAMQWAAWVIEGEERAKTPAPVQPLPVQAQPPTPAPTPTPVPVIQPPVQTFVQPPQPAIIAPPIIATPAVPQASVAKGDKKVVEAPPAPKTMLEEIDEIIQEMTEGTPLESQKVRLVADARSNVVVWVGPNHFEGVDAVVDPEIKELLRKAVAAWEKRHEIR